jgi:aldehyde:ferredoxin oxidoreductase
MIRLGFSSSIEAKRIWPGPDDIPAMGIRVLKTAREFNRKAGFTNKDDRLSKFFYEEPLPPHNTVIVISDDKMGSTFGF